MTAEVLMATPCTKSLGCESGGLGTSMEEMRGACLEREGWGLLKIPRGDIDGVGEVK